MHRAASVKRTSCAACANYFNIFLESRGTRMTSRRWNNSRGQEVKGQRSKIRAHPCSFVVRIRHSEPDHEWTRMGTDGWGHKKARRDGHGGLESYQWVGGCYIMVGTSLSWRAEHDRGSLMMGGESQSASFVVVVRAVEGLALTSDLWPLTSGSQYHRRGLAHLHDQRHGGP
jgi:hypothetical protein